MDRKELWTAGIFYTAFLAFLLTGISVIISPLKTGIQDNKVAIRDNKDAIQSLNAKMDQLIFTLLNGKPLSRPPAAPAGRTYQPKKNTQAQLK